MLVGIRLRLARSLKRGVSNFRKIILLSTFLFGAAPMAHAQNAFLSPGWVLDTESSVMEFQSTKESARGIKTETSTFAKFEGQIDESGAALITYYLDSVDTKIDLRNVRMRFLFFESFLFPYVQISAQLEPSMLNQLSVSRQLEIDLPVTLSLHGVSINKTVPVRVELADGNTVSIRSIAPVTLEISDFGLAGGLQKLEEAASVSIVPQTEISFNFRFTRASSAAQFAQARAAFVAGENIGTGAPAPLPVEVTTTVALETQGEFSAAECRGRFEILSRTDNITFGSNQDILRATSFPLLDSIVDIINRCPSLTVIVAGHTDSVGPDEYNQGLSERRAAAVVQYLEQNGADVTRIQAVGYGESRPAFPNTTRSNRQRNRRIEFNSLES